MQSDILKIASKKLRSRLIVGTGKYKSFIETAKAIEASGADMITVAVRRINITNKKKPILTDYINPKKLFTYLTLQAALLLRRLLELYVWLERWVDGS